MRMRQPAGPVVSSNGPCPDRSIMNLENRWNKYGERENAYKTKRSNPHDRFPMNPCCLETMQMEDSDTWPMMIPKQFKMP